MFLKQFNADGTPQRIEIQTNVSALVVTVTTLAADENITGIGSPHDSDFLAKLKQILHGLVNITRFDKSGQKTLVQNIQMFDLMEISAFGRSVINHKLTPNVDGTDFKCETTFILPLSNFGSIRADKAEFIVLEYTNPIVANVTYALDYIGSYVAQNEFLEIQNLTAQENQTTNFDCEENYLLVIPSTIDKVQMDSRTGETLHMNDREVDALQLLTTDAIHLINGRYVKSFAWNAIDVNQAYRGNLLLPAKSNFFLLANKSY